MIIALPLCPVTSDPCDSIRSRWLLIEVNRGQTDEVVVVNTFVANLNFNPEKVSAAPTRAGGSFWRTGALRNQPPLFTHSLQEME